MCIHLSVVTNYRITVCVGSRVVSIRDCQPDGPGTILGSEAYKRLDSSAHTPGSEPSIIGGLVYRESHPWALKRSLDAYGELQVPITNTISVLQRLMSVSHVLPPCVKTRN